jgi:hypothetical protein
MILWRILVVPPALLCRDWVVLLSVYWIYTIFAHRSKPWPWVTAGTMILLAVLYLMGQFPHTLQSWGAGS